MIASSYNSSVKTATEKGKEGVRNKKGMERARNYLFLTFYCWVFKN